MILKPARSSAREAAASWVTTFLPADDPGRGEVVRPKRLAMPRPWMIWADDDQLVVADHAAAQACWAGRSLDEAQVGCASPDPPGDGVAVGGGQDDLGRRLAPVLGVCLQRYQPAGQELLGDGQAGARPEPGLVVAAERGEPGIKFGRDREQPGGPFGDDDPLGGEPRSSWRPGDQRDTGLCLGRPDTHRRGLLGDAELPRAAFRLPAWATPSSISRAARSGMRALSGTALL
jgi:hypothetical protein